MLLILIFFYIFFKIGGYYRVLLPFFGFLYLFLKNLNLYPVRVYLLHPLFVLNIILCTSIRAGIFLALHPGTVKYAPSVNIFLLLVTRTSTGIPYITLYVSIGDANTYAVVVCRVFLYDWLIVDIM